MKSIIVTLTILLSLSFESNAAASSPENWIKKLDSLSNLSLEMIAEAGKFPDGTIAMLTEKFAAARLINSREKKYISNRILAAERQKEFEEKVKSGEIAVLKSGRSLRRRRKVESEEGLD